MYVLLTLILFGSREAKSLLRDAGAQLGDELLARGVGGQDDVVAACAARNQPAEM